MPKTLPTAWSLITDSWLSFIKNWNETFKVSIWFLYFGLVSFATALLLKVSGSYFFQMTSAIISVGVGIGFLWAGIRLFQAVFEIDAGKKPSLDVETSKKAAALIIPVATIGLLQLICILGGTLLFIVPGIFLAVSLSFSQLFRIYEGKKGFEALAASRNLVKGRWWNTLWLMLSGNLVFGVAIALIMSLVLGLLATIAGLDTFALEGSKAFQGDPLLNGAFDLLQNVAQAAIMPLFIIYQVKLYRALKATQA